MNSIDFLFFGVRPGSEARSLRAVPLPEPHRLLQALWGHSGRDSIVSGWARELADCHAELKRQRLAPSSKRRGFDEGEVRAEIDRLVVTIDRWARSNFPGVESGRMYRCSLGQIISDISMQFADAWWTVLHAKNEYARHRAWTHFARAFEEYSEIFVGAVERRIQLPDRSGATTGNRPGRHRTFSDFVVGEPVNGEENGSAMP